MLTTRALYLTYAQQKIDTNSCVFSINLLDNHAIDTLFEGWASECSGEQRCIKDLELTANLPGIEPIGHKLSFLGKERICFASQLLFFGQKIIFANLFKLYHHLFMSVCLSLLFIVCLQSVSTVLLNFFLESSVHSIFSWLVLSSKSISSNE